MISTELIRSLVVRDRPDLAGLPLRIEDEGWDFVVARLGPDLGVRLPRRRIATDRAAHAACYLEGIEDDLPLAAPTTVHLGRPSTAFRHHWRIARWVPGQAIADADFDSTGAGKLLGDLLHTMHRDAPPGAQVNADRSISIAARAARARADLRRMTVLSAAEIRAAEEVLSRAVAADGTRRPSTWVHGDLHPRNLLASGDGRLCGVIDFADAMRGDVALDAAVVYPLLPLDQHAAFRAAASHLDAAALVRAQGWAVAIGAWLWLDDPADRGMADMMVAGVRRAIAASLG